MSTLADSISNIHGFQAIIPTNSQFLNFSTVSAQSTALSSTATIVRLFATQDCYVRISLNPTASNSNSLFLPGGIVEYFGVSPLHKIAAIRSSADGVLYITEGA